MSIDHKPRDIVEVEYAEYAHEYLRSLPLEHFMEATTQGKQREITLESLALVHARRPEVQVFNELLVQYPRRGERRPGQVVPDNMVVVSKDAIEAEGSFDVPLQPVGPFWVLEYVSKHSRRKDYDDNFHKYEKELKVPYYLLFHPEIQQLTLYRHNGKSYSAVKANEHGRFSVPKLELEVGLVDCWVRFWFRGELLPLPGELQGDLDEERRRTAHLESQLKEERQARLAAERELERLKRQARPGHKGPRGGP